MNATLVGLLLHVRPILIIDGLGGFVTDLSKCGKPCRGRRAGRRQIRGFRIEKFAHTRRSRAMAGTVDTVAMFAGTSRKSMNAIALSRFGASFKRRRCPSMPRSLGSGRRISFLLSRPKPWCRSLGHAQVKRMFTTAGASDRIAGACPKPDACEISIKPTKSPCDKTLDRKELSLETREAVIAGIGDGDGL